MKGLDKIAPKTSNDIFMGSMEGAAAGSSAGPYGALAGMLIGGGTGAYTGNQRVKQEQSQNAANAWQGAAVDDEYTNPEISQREKEQQDILNRMMLS